jgi:hypothetical protein
MIDRLIDRTLNSELECLQQNVQIATRKSYELRVF